MDRDYYLVTGQKTKQAVSDFHSSYKAIYSVIVGAVQSLGGTAFCRAGPCISGIKFDDPPEGWVQIRGPNGYYTPHRRLKVCRDARDKFDAIPRLPTGRDFADVSGFSSSIDAFSIEHPIFEVFGENYVISAPRINGAPQPEIAGTKRLKLSEYHKIREQEDETG